MPKVSVIITNYNQSQTLAFLLKSLERQEFSDFEIIVADDGSTDQSRQVVEEAARSFPGRSIRWETQDDRGYRKAKILNQAVRVAHAPYLVFLDADVIVSRKFIADHWNQRSLHGVVCGRRVDLGPEVSSRVTKERVLRGDFDGVSWSLLWSALKKDSVGMKRGFRIQNRILRKLLGYEGPIDILGSNFSLWKSDLLHVNGFNEALEEYWGEDGDLFIRLRNSGVKMVGAKGLCIQFHIFHTRRVPSLENVKKYQELLTDSTYKWAELGIQK